MISLNPPYQVVDGYTVLPDHADPNLFYVLPAAPHIAKKADGGPGFSMLQFLGGGLGAAKLEGGLLTLTTALSVPDEALNTLRGKLANRLHLDSPGALRLMAVLFDSGVVELVALGSASQLGGDTQDEAKAQTLGPFKVRFLGSGKPALSGENVSSFQLLLDAPAAELLEHSLDAPDQPIIIIYRMTFSGLRPSFQIDIQADWHKVYRSIENKAKANVYYVAADAESMISDAFENSGIRVDTAVFGTDESARSAAERARKQLLDWALEHLFTPMVDPASATANAVGRVIDDTVWSLTRSLVPGVSYKLRVMDEEQLRFLSVRMNESVAERREVVPQGTIGGFLRAYQVDAQGQPRPEWPAMRDGLVQKINIDGFPRLEVKVGIEDRFAADGLSSVQVELTRAEQDGSLKDQKSLLLRSASEREDYVVNLLGRASLNFAALYQYRVTVNFDPAGPFGPHDAVTSDWAPGTTAELFVEPRYIYTMREIEIGVAPIFSFVQFPQITVELKYSGEGQAALQTERVRLNEQQQTAKWRFRSFLKHAPSYSYRVTYHRDAASGGDLETPWRESIDDWLAVSDPLPDKYTLNVLVNLSWDQIDIAFMRMKYDDETNNIHYDLQLDLSPEVRHLRRDWPVAANGPRFIAYQLTIFMKDGSLLEGSWRETGENRVLIDRRLVDRKVLRMRVLGGTMADNRLSEVRILLQQREPNSEQVRQEKTISLKAGDEARPIDPWEFLPGDPPVRTIHYSAWLIDLNGFIDRKPWQSTDSDLLIVHLKNKTISA